MWVSDDGSTDKTLDVIKSFSQKSKCRVSSANWSSRWVQCQFLSPLERCDGKADYFAFSDQDDIWQPEKLKRAIEKLSTVPSSVPAVYAGRTTLVDEHLRFIRHSVNFPAIIPYALVQNVMSGNTMVLMVRPGI